MTTVAYKNGVIASDTQVSCQGIAIGSQVKIGKVGKVLYGACGTVALTQGFFRWVREGMSQYHYPKMTGDDAGARGIVILDDYVLTLSDVGLDMIKTKHHAIGSGAELALGQSWLSAQWMQVRARSKPSGSPPRDAVTPAVKSCR